MNVNVVGRHMDVTEAMKAYAMEKVGKLPHFYDSLLSADVYFATDAGEYLVEIVAHGKRKSTFVARHQGKDRAFFRSSNDRDGNRCPHAIPFGNDQDTRHLFAGLDLEQAERHDILGRKAGHRAKQDQERRRSRLNPDMPGMFHVFLLICYTLELFYIISRSGARRELSLESYN